MTIKEQLINFVRQAGRPVSRKEIANEYAKITGKKSNNNLSMGLCYAMNGGHGGYNNYCTQGYLCRNTGYGCIKAIARNQYIAE